MGPRRDLKLLGVLAQHTGGVVMMMVAATRSRRPAMQALPVSNLQSPRRHRSFIRSTRSRRLQVETGNRAGPAAASGSRDVRASSGQLANAASLTAVGQFSGQPLRMEWSVSGLQSETAAPFVAAAFRQAGKDGGLVPYAGENC